MRAIHNIIFFIACLILGNHAFAFDNSLPVKDSNTLPIGFEGGKASYRVQLADATVAATATDVVTLCGSATKTVRVMRIQATADATAASVIDFYVYKRTAVNTGGTSAAVTAAQMDSTDVAPTAVVLKYSVNPTGLGTGVLFTGDHYALPAAASTGYPGMPWIEDFGVRNNRTIVLRGVAQCVSFSLNGQTIPAGFGLYLGIEWTEE
jgi:hypothetical protein